MKELDIAEFPDAKAIVNYLESLSEVSVVDFWSPTCISCRMLKRLLENIPDTVCPVYSVCVTDYMELADDYNITNLPTILFFKDGEVVDRIPGLTTEKVLLEKIKQIKGE